RIPILQQMLRPVRQIVMDSIDGITEPKIGQVPARDEWTVAQLMSHITEIEYFGMEEAVLITKESDPDITRSDVENDRRAAAVVDRAGDSLEEHI
ncbi:MAG: DinB family protein, partial [Dehalococcoidia bacterium]|nr:DinB family protein [Dehalococcoidia bacterium]